LKKRILIFCESDPNKEPRLIRTIEALQNNYNLTVGSYVQCKNCDFIDLREFIEKKQQIKFHLKYPTIIRKPISLLLNIFYYRTRSKTDFGLLNPFFNNIKAKNEISKKEFDVIICHGLGFLELSAMLKKKPVKLILNAHEYYPSEFEDKPEWKETGEKYIKILNSCAPKIDLIFAVNETIGLRYKKEFKIDFVEITNATDYEVSLKPVEVKNPIKIVHHGVALKNRKIELMIEAVLKTKTPCELHLILVPTEKDYYQDLIEKYKDKKEISFEKPVEVKQIAQTINKFDVGLFYLEPVNYNWLHALPNKLFEFVQARLAVVVSPNPDMKNLVEKYDLGWVVNDFTSEALVKTLDEISPEKIKNFKLNADKYAKELSSMKAKEAMLNAINQLCAA
jgi:glycosyltransferase involved in cell wall biosynthesis